jgi:hypothetical protein
MKRFRAFLPCFVIVFGMGISSGCATGGGNSAATSPVPDADGMKGIEQKPPAENAGWADSLGWIFLESLYATAVANSSN